MIPARGLPNTATILRAARVTDRYGNQAMDWTNTTTHDVACFIQSGISGGATSSRTGGSEVFDLRDALIMVFRMFTNDTDITGYDRVLFDGMTFEVIGPPAVWTGPNGFHHLDLSLKYVEG